MRRPTSQGALALVLLLLMTAPANASGSTANADCAAHGRLTASYSVAQLRAALQSMPADQKEYTNCYSEIQRALLATLPTSRDRSGGSDAAAGGSFLSTPLIIAIVVLALGVGSAGVVALRRRNQPSSDP